jgi:hypothetical protein
MIRRTLQFVLMLTVLVSASAAQVLAMPCCTIAPAHAPVTAPPPEDQATSMHCHSAMHHAQMALDTASATSCPGPVCTSHVDTAAPAAEDTLLSPLLNATVDSLLLVAVQPTNSLTARATHSAPPHLQQSPVPLRI